MPRKKTRPTFSEATQPAMKIAALPAALGRTNPQINGARCPRFCRHAVSAGELRKHERQVMRTLVVVDRKREGSTNIARGDSDDSNRAVYSICDNVCDSTADDIDNNNGDNTDDSSGDGADSNNVRSMDDSRDGSKGGSKSGGNHSHSRKASKRSHRDYRRKPPKPLFPYL